MPPHNLINIKSHIILVSVGRLHWDKVRRYSQPVHNNPYRVMLPPSPRKTNHKVHINGFPLPSRNLNNMSQNTRLKMLCLNLLTIRTLIHIFCNVLHYSIPPIDLLKIMIYLGGTCLYGIWKYGPMPQSWFKNIQIWYTQPILIPKYAITS
ncbi:hypothetical protein EJD97_006086, partial [Solanum chilense]